MLGLSVPEGATVGLWSLKEVFFSSAEISDAVRYAVRTGMARRLGPRLYTKIMTSTPGGSSCTTGRDRRRLAPPRSSWAGRHGLKPARDGRSSWSPGQTRDVRLPGLRLRPLSSPRAKASRGVRYDPLRIERFERLAMQLLASGAPEVAEDASQDVSGLGSSKSYSRTTSRAPSTAMLMSAFALGRATRQRVSPPAERSTPRARDRRAVRMLRSAAGYPRVGGSSPSSGIERALQSGALCHSRVRGRSSRDGSPDWQRIWQYAYRVGRRHDEGNERSS